MKKFFTYIPMQNPAEILYESDNEKLRMMELVHFPVVALVNGYAEAGDEICVIVMLEEENETCRENLKRCREELQEIANRKGVFCYFEEILVSRDESASAQLQTFRKLIDQMEDYDVLHACITFGTKPIPIVELMALNFAYKTRKEVTIACIAYGKINWKGKNLPGEGDIYDVTALFYMNEVANLLACAGIQNPAESIARMLQIGLN